MLVNYEKNQSVREFEFVEQVSLQSKAGKTYKRMFWRLSGTENIATYLELNNSFEPNREMLSRIRKVLDNRVIGFSFGKKPKDKHNPQYEISLAGGKSVKLTYAELKKKLQTLENLDEIQEMEELMLDSPFVLGANMYSQAHDIVGKVEEEDGDFF